MDIILKIISPQWMLLLGLILAAFIQEKPDIQNKAKSGSKKLLQASVILLGANLNFNQVLKQGAEGFGITAISLTLIFIVGHLLMKLFKIEKEQGLLIIMGTAICGGSAIAALAPVILASSASVATAMGVVFLLNALAVFIFPPMGELLHMAQDQFGIFAALAIHDTSSVVAAGSIYGSKALEVATMVKLTRALWIIPMTLIFSFRMKKSEKGKVNFPKFMIGFLALSLLFTLVEDLAPLRPYLKIISKLGLAITLGLIGLSLNFQSLKKFGPKVFFFAVSLWLFTIVNALTIVKFVS